jgi:hypothetical protein
MRLGPGTKEEEGDDAFDNSGQAFDADIDTIYGTEDAEVSEETEDKSEENETEEETG